MVRNFVRKTTKGLHSPQSMKEAISLVESGLSLRVAAKIKNVNYMTLSRYVKTMKNKSKEEQQSLRLTPNYAHRKVFSSDQEKKLKEFIINSSKTSNCFDAVECRKLAYEMAVSHQLKIPNSWKQKGMAGIDWFHGFRQRNRLDLTLRKPEPCRLITVTSPLKQNINIFFNNLHKLMRLNHSFSVGTRLYCLGETGTTIVQEPEKNLTADDASAKCGTLVTTYCVISACGYALPPAMVFPRRVFKPFMLNDAPVGTLGLAQPTGCMTSELFVDVMKHFIEVTCSSQNNPTLLILDKHNYHVIPAVLNIAKENGVTFLTIPSHTSHKLHPLDVSVLGPFHTFYSATVDSWMMRHPGRTPTINDVAGLVCQAFDKAMTPINIKSGYRNTGIFPFNRNIFSDDDFMSREVTCQEKNLGNQHYVPSSFSQDPEMPVEFTIDPLKNSPETQPLSPADDDEKSDVGDLSPCILMENNEHKYYREMETTESVAGSSDHEQDEDHKPCLDDQTAEYLLIDYDNQR